MSTQSDTIKQVVRIFVEDNFLMKKDGDLPDDASFLGRGILDSTGVLELVGFLEDRFRIEVSDHEMLPENLDSLSAIEAYIKKKGGKA
jgi:acyl carrier protein